MGAIPFSRFCKNPSKVFGEVVDRDKPVTVTCADGKAVNKGVRNRRTRLIPATEFVRE